MRLFDSHCHLDDDVYNNDIRDVFIRAQEAAVRAMMVVGISVASSQQVVRLAQNNKTVFASIGIHPHDARECSAEALTVLRELALHPKVRAWGEIGLDFNRMFSPRVDQETHFIRQLEEADAIGLPTIFHERDSNGRFLEIIQSHTRNACRSGVVHCFSGTESELNQYLDLGLHIGITGIITIKTRGEALRRLVKKIPVDRLLVETDAPYLTPTPERNRFRRNEPAFVRSVLFKLAEVLQQSPEDLAEILWKNTCEVFRISTDEAGDQDS